MRSLRLCPLPQRRMTKDRVQCRLRVRIAESTAFGERAVQFEEPVPWQRAFPAPELASSRALSGPVVFLRRDVLADIVVQALVYRPGLALRDFFWGRKQRNCRIATFRAKCDVAENLSYSL